MYGGGPYVVVKNIPEWKTVPVGKNYTGGENVTSGQNVAAWTTCHIGENVSHMDELSHTEQSSLLRKWDHCMYTPP